MARHLPNGKQQFIDLNGNPLALGWVYFYIPATTTPKSTWQDSAKSILNTNPIHLDAGGYAVIWGEGLYRQIVQNAALVQIWDQVVSSGEGPAGIAWGGVGGGIPNAQTVTVPGFVESDGSIFEFIPGVSNSGGTTLTVNGGTPRQVFVNGPTGPIAAVGSTLIAGNPIQVVFVSGLGGYVAITSSQISFNTLAVETAIHEEDFGVYYDVSSAANRKILILDWLISLINGLANENTLPHAGDQIAMYNSVDTRVDKIALTNALKVIAKLKPGKDLDEDDYQIPVVALSDQSIFRQSIRNVGGYLRPVGVEEAVAGDGALGFHDLGQCLAVVFTICGAVPDTNDSRLILQVSTDNGATWIATGYINLDAVTTSSMLVCTDTAGNRVSSTRGDGGVNGQIVLTNLANAKNKTLSGVVTWMKSSSVVKVYTLGATYVVGTSVNAVRFKWDAGNFDSGKIYAGGITK